MEEEIEIVEHPPKIKANINKKTRQLMAQKKRKPRFIRQQLWQFKKLREIWRRPRGRHSKQRKHLKYRPPTARIGYASPKKVRNLHPSGFKERIINNTKEFENIDKKTEAIKIAGKVGKKKRMEIIQKADEMGIRVLNRGI